MADRYSPDLFTYSLEPPVEIFPSAGESVKPSRDWLGSSVKPQAEPSSLDGQGERYCNSKFGKDEVTEDEAVVISDDSEDEVTRSEASSSACKTSAESGKGANGVSSSCASGHSSRGKKKFVFKKIVTSPVDLVTSPCDATETSVPSRESGSTDGGGNGAMCPELRPISVQSAAVDDDSSFEISPIVGRPVGASYRSRLNFTKAPICSSTPQTAGSFTTYRDPQRRRGSDTNEDAEVRPQRRTQSPDQPAVSPVGPSSGPGVDSSRDGSSLSPESAGDRSAGRASSSPPAPVRPSVKPEVLQLSRLSLGDLNKRLEQKKLIRNMTNLSALPDGGRKLQVSIRDLEAAVEYKQQQTTDVSFEEQLARGSSAGTRTHSRDVKAGVAAKDRNTDSEGDQHSREETNRSRPPGSSGTSPGRTSSDPDSSPRSQAEFPGGSRNSADSTGSARPDPVVARPEVEALTRMSLEEIQRRLEQKKIVRSATNLSALPDGGRRLRQMIVDLETARDMKLNQSSNSADRPDSDNNLSRLQIQRKLQQLRTQYSTSSQHSGSNETDNLSKEIVALQKTLMKMDLAGDQLPSANGAVGCESLPRGPGVGLQARHVPLNKLSVPGDHGGAKQRTAKLIAQPSSYEDMLKEGGRTTSFVTDEQRSLEARARESLRDFGSVPAHLMSALYAANPEINKLYGGRMTAARHREALNVTTDALERLHGSLRSRPAAEATSPGPACLTVPLMPHQLHAMAWLQWRERQEPPGGILADDMGLGKTLTMIAHCLRCTELRDARLQQQRQLREADDTAASDSNDEEHQWLSKAKSMKARENVVMSRGTLVVCPASVLNQWESEVKRRTSGHVSVQIYHGNARNVSARQLADNHFVLTTYGIIQRELDDESEGDAPATAAKGCLARVCWERVVLDESHQVRNPATKTARAVYRIRAGRRWAVTGTPVHNKREDVFSMMRFLRMAPFNEKEIWKRWIDNSAQGEERLSLLIRALVLRRSKTDVSPITGKSLVNLPERQKLLHMVKLSPEEKAVYEEVFEYSRAALQEFIKLQEQREFEKELITNPLARPPSSLRHASGSGQLGLKGDGAAVRRPVRGEIKQHHILVQLLRLRQICCHPALAKTMLESGEHQTAGFDVADEADALGDRLGGMSLGGDRAGSTAEEEDTAGPDVMTADNPVFQQEFRSAKLRLLLEKLSPVLARGEKAVVVSQWSTMLSIVADHLNAERVRHCTISGAVAVKDRQPLVERFNNDPRGPPVLLLSIGAGGVGLNLVGGNHLFLLDPHWNPQMEEQAGDRVYRVGQTRPVFMHRLICEGSLEQRVMELQRKKMELASNVLSGQARQATNRLTMSDLKTLFQLK